MKQNNFIKEVEKATTETSDQIFDAISEVWEDKKYSTLSDREKSAGVLGSLNLILDGLALGMIKNNLFRIRQDYKDAPGEGIAFYLQDVRKGVDGFIKLEEEGKFEHLQ
jgi:hypothetical protein